MKILKRVFCMCINSFIFVFIYDMMNVNKYNFVKLILLKIFVCIWIYFSILCLRII